MELHVLVIINRIYSEDGKRGNRKLERFLVPTLDTRATVYVVPVTGVRLLGYRAIGCSGQIR